MKTRERASLPSLKLLKEPDDPYRLDIPDKSYCTQCGLGYVNRSWKFDVDKSKMKHKIVCPACRKINDKYFLGILTIKGAFLNEHKDEILSLIHNEEKKHRSKNALQRIGETSYEKDGSIIISTTNVRLAYRIGRALYKAYRGILTIKWSGNNIFIRVYWTRNDT